MTAKKPVSLTAFKALKRYWLNYSVIKDNFTTYDDDFVCH